MFDDKYFPQSVRNDKEREFISFQQDNLSVMEYDIEYSRLSMFVPHLVDTEEKNNRRVVYGLKAVYQRHIVGNPMIDTYVRAVECAMELEQDFLAHKRDEEYLKKESKVDRASKASSSQHGGGKKRKGHLNQGNRGQKDGGNERAVVSAEGEVVGAKPINFYGFCYNYRERGHKASECTKEKVQTTDIREQPNTGVANCNVHLRGQGQLFAVQPPETENATLGGTFFILGETVSILFDTGATHSFIFAKLVRVVNFYESV
ncbi:uncharacterized protein LOC113316131 [Papaver somniferum]|uniref:uncharacterized protein LOC113316131 n=1 Tax=Papaver somniferum TaxID=3469 RepID=UPI000E6F8447|nr:uncharacterized protein LOC113316131 [Papaver somniferum]